MWLWVGGATPKPTPKVANVIMRWRVRIKIHTWGGGVRKGCKLKNVCLGITDWLSPIQAARTSMCVQAPARSKKTEFPGLFLGWAGTSTVTDKVRLRKVSADHQVLRWTLSFCQQPQSTFAKTFSAEICRLPKAVFFRLGEKVCFRSRTSRQKVSAVVLCSRWVLQQLSCSSCIPCSLHPFSSAITKPDICARIVVEMGSHLTKGFLFNHTTPFSTKGLEKSLCDFTRTIFVQSENPVVWSGGLFVDVARCSAPVSPILVCRRLLLYAALQSLSCLQSCSGFCVGVFAASWMGIPKSLFQPFRMISNRTLCGAPFVLWIHGRACLVLQHTATAFCLPHTCLHGERRCSIALACLMGMVSAHLTQSIVSGFVRSTGKCHGRQTTICISRA